VRPVVTSGLPLIACSAIIFHFPGYVFHHGTCQEL
jgi:hypothetical protein